MLQADINISWFADIGIAFTLQAEVWPEFTARWPQSQNLEAKLNANTSLYALLCIC